MKISATNDITDAGALTVPLDADSGQDINDITTADFSTAYTSDGTSATFTIDKVFTSGVSCRYVAFAGHNFSDIGCSVVVKVNTVTKATINFYTTDSNWVTMVTFDQVASTTNVQIIVTKTSTDRATISYLAIGDTLDSTFTFPEQNVAPAGFPINWRTRSSEIRSVINDAGQPVANIRQSMARKTTLSLKNIAQTVISSALWLKFLGLAYTEGAFFYKDDDGTVIADEPKSGVMAFNVDVMPPKLHSSTRKLVDLSIKFSAYTGG